MVLFQQLTEASQLPTPGRSDMHNREAVNRSPMSTATQCASKLQALLAGHRNAPSEELRALLSTFSHTLEASIPKTVSSMSGTFCAAYVQNLLEQQGRADANLARRQLQMGEMLFYKALESIVIEMKQQKPHTDLSVYLSNSAFQRSLFACCLEIVMFCYNSQREFPWILEVFCLKPYNFYKITEPLIRAEKGLWREVIKHLNQIEEQILESLAWKDDSPLWDVMSRSHQIVPQCKEVFPQWRIEVFQESDKNGHNGTLSPGAHLSPSSSGSDQRHFSSNETGSSAGSCHSESAAHITASPAPSSPEATKDNKPPRCDSLALFFRKVYHLAAVRFFDMCERLGIQKDIQHKIWTCFEHSLVAHIDLMRDRHLDQLLLCALYVGAKVTKFATNFGTILNCYREQSHKKSHVYRSVYLERNAGHEERGDIIKFYNNVYVSRMTTFVKSFCSGTKMNEIICLTPLPRAKYMLNSPKRQVSPNIKVFVSPMKADHFATPERHTYHFNQSPAKDLLRINETIKTCADVARKRIFHDGDALEDGPPTKKPAFSKKIEAFVRDQQDVQNGGCSLEM
ncbi:retinoblastoma-like protein 1 [Dermacentor variabilis]|uniref:retinoblastoma-like protein 1 n=1 Tax=Dermacentor variabilis TaxID=34621 RepID=UPI003F5B3AB2